MLPRKLRKFNFSLDQLDDLYNYCERLQQLATHHTKYKYDVNIKAYQILMDIKYQLCYHNKFFTDYDNIGIFDDPILSIFEILNIIHPSYKDII